MAFDIPIVIDRSTLDALVTPDAAALALIDWLAERNTKAVILQSDWKAFCKEWEDALADNPSCKEAFFSHIRGLVRPYRKEGITSPEPTNKIDAIKEVVNRDYDTIEFLILTDTGLIHPDGIKIDASRVVTLQGFYEKINFPQGTGP